MFCILRLWSTFSMLFFYFYRNVFQKYNSVRFGWEGFPGSILGWEPVKFYLACLQTTHGAFVVAPTLSFWVLLNHIRRKLPLFSTPTQYPGIQPTHPLTPPVPFFLVAHIRTLPHLGNFWDSSVGVSAASTQPSSKVLLHCSVVPWRQHLPWFLATFHRIME